MAMLMDIAHDCLFKMHNCIYIAMISIHCNAIYCIASWEHRDNQKNIEILVEGLLDFIHCAHRAPRPTRWDGRTWASAGFAHHLEDWRIGQINEMSAPASLSLAGIVLSFRRQGTNHCPIIIVLLSLSSLPGDKSSCENIICHHNMIICHQM